MECSASAGRASSRTTTRIIPWQCLYAALTAWKVRASLMRLAGKIPERICKARCRGLTESEKVLLPHHLRVPGESMSVIRDRSGQAFRDRSGRPYSLERSAGYAVKLVSGIAGGGSCRRGVRDVHWQPGLTHMSNSLIRIAILITPIVGDQQLRLFLSPGASSFWQWDGRAVCWNGWCLLSGTSTVLLVVLGTSFKLIFRSSLSLPVLCLSGWERRPWRGVLIFDHARQTR